MITPNSTTAPRGLEEPLPSLRPRPIWVRQAELGARPSPVGAASRLSTRARRSDLCRQAGEVIRRGYADPALTLSGVAAEIAVSPRLLQLIFCERNTSFKDELLKIRMTAALRLVLKGHETAAIAPKVGYAYRTHFSAAFERCYGVTPAMLSRALDAQARYERRAGLRPPSGTPAYYRWRRDMRRDGDLVRAVAARLDDPEPLWAKAALVRISKQSGPPGMGSRARRPWYFRRSRRRRRW